MCSKIIITDSVPEVRASIVPMLIQYTGEANTEDFYTASRRTKDGTSEAQFRGLRLLGQTLDIGNKNAFVLASSEYLVQDPSDPENIQTAKQYAPVAKIKDFTIFGHDSFAPLNSKWKLMSEWDTVADAIHS